MLQSIFKTKEVIDRDDDQLGAVRMDTATLIKMMIRDYLWPNKKLFLISMISMAVVGAMTGAIPLLLKVSADEIIVGRNRAMLSVVPIAIIVVMVTKAVAEYVSTVTETFIGIQITADLRRRVVDSLMKADLSWLQISHSGRFVVSFMTDVAEVTGAATLSIIAFAKNLLRSGFLIGTMFYLDWRLAILVVLALPIAVYFLGRNRKKMYRSSKQTMAETGDMGSMITQALSGIRVVKAYDREDTETSRIGTIIDRANEFSMRAVRIRNASGPMTEALTGFGIALAILYGGWRGQQGTMTLGDFMGFITAAMLIYQPLRQMATLQTTLQSGVAAASRIFSIIDHKPKIVDGPDAAPLAPVKGEIEFRDVNFAYDGSDIVLNKINFKVPAGKSFALVGASGSGKSTIMNLLLRFYDPSSGQVLIDGQDISKATISSVRQSTALVTQEAFLFDDTIRANIAYGSEDKSEEEIIVAAKAAVAHDFITALPDGYDSRAGEAGSRLSGGQKQRIAIARAMLRDAPILLLDEPTSALDSESEAKIQEALEHLIKDRTVLMIAHRLSTVRNADMILVLDKGQIVEKGTHAQLLRKKGVYAKLHKTQLTTENAKKPAKGKTAKTAPQA